MKIDWSLLTTELALWRNHDLPLPIWWRDDDAIADTPALQRLSQIANDVGVPVHIAVIPDPMTPSLPPAIKQNPHLIPIIHGWRHVSHAPEGSKNAEFGHPRPEAAAELKQAIEVLEDGFGDQLIKLFVPPWNRISPDLLPVLATAGYRGVSTYGARGATHATTGLMQINTHIDPIYWRGHRGLVAPEVLIEGIAATLRERREGRTDTTEPLGLLTHHLVHDEDIWAFSGDVLRVLLDGGAKPADIGGLLQAERNPNI
ncbi:polysaccharide deacetylase family protein [Sulfitobacter sp.]|uniref:polysaccharide deacetylase family protein n=1 Tax=Sulfitobacter sp. TaxID=1903071 RepID=UPI003002D077